MFLEKNPSMHASGGTLLVGAGNPLRRDDGAGIHVVRRLAAEGLPEGCESVELPGGWLTLVDHLGRCRRLVVVDACDLGLSPGVVVEVDVRSLGEGGGTAWGTGHAVGLRDALALAAEAGLAVPRDVRVFAIQVEDVEGWSDECSPPVTAALGEACAAVRQALTVAVAVKLPATSSSSSGRAP